MKPKIILSLAVAVLLGIFLLGCRTMDEGTAIGGLDVSGRTAWQVYSELRSAEKSLNQKALTLSLPEETLTLSPWVRFSKLKGILSAYRQADTPLEVRYNKQAVLSALEGYAAKYDTALSPSGYHLEGPAPDLSTRSFDGNLQTLVLDPGVPERRLDADAALNALEDFYRYLFSREGYRINLEVPAQAEPETLNLDAIYEELYITPVDDSLDMETYQEIPGSYGCRFDLDRAKALLAEEPVTLPMEAIAPEIMGQALYFRDELGRCETKHTDDENRNTNLRLVCKALDGLILQPGEEFSYNGSVGERTAEKGYKPAGAYSGNRLVKDIGGGVCQGSTTLYNCALLADLEILERNGHGFTVNYVPIGLDAAVNWATKTDLRFRNSWNFPIMIKAEVSGGYMRMQLLGTDEKDYYIEMTSTRGDTELRIYSNSYKHKYDKETGEHLSKELEARSSYMYMQ